MEFPYQEKQAQSKELALSPPLLWSIQILTLVFIPEGSMLLSLLPALELWLRDFARARGRHKIEYFEVLPKKTEFISNIK